MYKMRKKQFDLCFDSLRTASFFSFRLSYDLFGQHTFVYIVYKINDFLALCLRNMLFRITLLFVTNEFSDRTLVLSGIYPHSGIFMDNVDSLNFEVLPISATTC